MSFEIFTTIPSWNVTLSNPRSNAKDAFATTVPEKRKELFKEFEVESPFVGVWLVYYIKPQEVYLKKRCVLSFSPFYKGVPEAAHGGTENTHPQKSTDATRVGAGSPTGCSSSELKSYIGSTGDWGITNSAHLFAELSGRMRHSSSEHHSRIGSAGEGCHIRWIMWEPSLSKCNLPSMLYCTIFLLF